MPVHNQDIAKVLNRVADMLEIKGENVFRIRAYRTAANTVSNLPEDAVAIIAKGQDLSDLPGIGKDLAGKIKEIADTGTLTQLENLYKQFPRQLSDILELPGVGPKRVGTLYKKLGVENLDELQQAAESGRVHDLAGFGLKTEMSLLEEIRRIKEKGPKRMRLPAVEEYAQSLIDYLKKHKDIYEIMPAGSYRRKKDSIGDLDILATCKDPHDLAEYFTSYDETQKVLAKGETRSSILLRSGLQVDLRIVDRNCFGAASVYFTGSKDHNVAIRTIAVKKKLKISEYGVFSGDKKIAGEIEEQVYKTIGLDYIEPELRENQGEIEAAHKKQLPKLVTLNDIKGDLHVHTRYSDGNNSIEEMVIAAKEQGYEYVSISDHSQHVTVAGGLKPEQLAMELKEMDKIQKKHKDIRLLRSCEVDILVDGNLDMPDDLLKHLDVRVCSLHYKFDLPRRKQTDRVLKAMDNPYFNIFGHPTGRLIGERNPYDIDLEKIMIAARERGCLLELNSHSHRLDLDDIHCRQAKLLGVKIVISTDSHSTRGLKDMRFGIYQARRGWLEPDDVANTRPLKQLLKLFDRK